MWVAAIAAPAGNAAAPRPNILVLVADDWGFSDVGAFGGEIATPNLDLLARRGVRFSNFHGAASCSSTRSMLLTGVDNHRNGVGNLREAMPADHLGKPGCLGSLLQDTGYRTDITCKWNVGSEPQNLPDKRGFDLSIVQGDTGLDNWQPQKLYLPHRPTVDWFEGGKPARMPADYYLSEYLVDRIDPLTLKTLEQSPRLTGGPMWPGGMAVHRSGDLPVVYGRYAHRLDRHCAPQAKFCLPLDEPYDSFVLLDNGLVVTKKLSDTTPAQLTVLDPHNLQPVCAHLTCPEPSVARLSAVGNSVYVVGVRSIFRYDWREDSGRLEMDASWHFDYAGGTQQSYGWDVVLDGRDAWFMDNGKHRYVVSMIVVAFDSANRHLRAWRISADRQALTPLWHKTGFGVASHMVLYPQSGELVTNDYRRLGEEVVVLNIETGAELSRVRSGGVTQGVVFPAPGWNRDVYWCSMGRLARVFVQPAA